jgi:hypothetical protein
MWEDNAFRNDQLKTSESRRQWRNPTRLPQLCFFLCIDVCSIVKLLGYSSNAEGIEYFFWSYLRMIFIALNIMESQLLNSASVFGNPNAQGEPLKRLCAVDFHQLVSSFLASNLMIFSMYP